MRHTTDFISLHAADTAARMGARIRRARKARKMSLTQLEHICRVHRTTLGRLERGETSVSLSVLLAVLEALDELADVEMIVSQPDTPKHKRIASAPLLDRDF